MKSIRLFFFIPFLFLACLNKKNENCIIYDSGFSICQDTILINIKGKMTHALKYHNKYYILFKQKIFKYGGYEKRWLYIFYNGKIEKIIDLPNQFDTVYLDFYLKNDSLILKPYMNKQSYYLDIINYEWNKLDQTDDLIFEDDFFYVYSLNFGEWGGKSWFKDKSTGKEYVIESKTPLINKIDTTYFLTDECNVLKIENPLKLNKCNNDITYENIEKSEKCYTWYGEPIGFDRIYANLDSFTFNNHTIILAQETNIQSSFVWQNELFHIYQPDTITYIAKIDNDSLKIIQKIGEGFNFYNQYYSYRCRNLNNNNQLLKFETKNDNSFGLVEIIDSTIQILHFLNQAELKPKPQGTLKADSIFVNRFNLILSGLDKLKLTDIELKEQNWGTFNVTPNHLIGLGTGLYPNSNHYKLDTIKSYFIEEDSLISNSISYYGTQSNNLIKVILFKWEETNLSRFDLDKLTRETFISKLNFLENFLIKKLGEPSYIRKEKNKYPSKIWKTSNELTIQLTNAISSKTNYNEIILVIYKD